MVARRSSRTNKGIHTKRIIEELYDDYDGSPDSGAKKVRIEERDDDEEYKEDTRNVTGNTSDVDSGNSSGGEEEEEEDDGKVRCTPCGTTAENYNEDTDKGGMMIECDSCKYWQHARCMGYRSSKSIPKEYKCDLCLKLTNGNQQDDEYSLESLREKHRISSAKAFLAFFKKSIPENYAFPKGFDNDKLARKWTIELENVIYKTASKKYNEESRRILFLIRRPNVIRQVLNNELTFGKLVTAPPEEVDLELKQYAEKVRQESIRRSVLTADDEAQRIRRTHKGEEVVEDVSNNNEDLEVNIVGRNIDHRRFKDDSPTMDIKVDKTRQNSYNFIPDDDDEEEAEDFGKDQLLNEETKSSELSDVDGEIGPSNDSDDDETMKLIINGKPKEEKKSLSSKQQKPALPSAFSTDIWSGKITFPEFASFSAKGTFYSYSNYVEPNTAENVKIHNKLISISKEILSRSAYEIEGRLDRRRADDYLNKIISTRALCLVQITCSQEQHEFDRLFNYLLNKNKVGVLSGKPSFVKDSYLIAIDFNDPNLPPYLQQFKKNVNVGLFALYVVKKDYVPARPGILKSQASTSFQSEPAKLKPHDSSNNEMLSSILKQLNQLNENVTSNPSSDTTHDIPINLSNIPNGRGKEILSNLNPQQMEILKEICLQNPQIAENPEAYFQVLQTYLNIS